uniref:Pitrilysin metalloproteinase 1 n=1 Tax=Rousettus aegyptiacus TaxID=9407 RepID=A0A7J8E9J8_ROUAE|nr:pitrilysin metallopeptidase 1 [Rousettus aegyptiacus]
MWRCSRPVPVALRRLSGRSAELRAWRWGSTTACERALQYRVGEKMHGYTVSQVTPVPELFLTAVKLDHDGTGARHLHLAREDSNNLFSVQFRTTPMDSTGVPHILEHTVLCGSQKYPCRDPFFKMLNRSLSTFMNAFTASDYTMYPFSTQNPKDFQHLQNQLLPDHTYAAVSGGAPLCIPDLTWEQLREFHAKHYHPSNARFLTYGNFPLEEHLRQIHEEALSKFQRIEPNTAVPPQQRWEMPREHHVHCAPDALAAGSPRQTTVSVSFLLPDITDTAEAFALTLLSTLLVSGPSAPFYKALIESGLGSDFSPDVGYNGHTRDAYFSVGLQGVAEADVARVRDIIDRTLDDVIANGFEDDQIEALLHKIEIRMKHQSVSFGLALASHIASCWNHDGDPVELLQLGAQVAQFRRRLEENPEFLQEKVKQYFKNNRHKLTLSMRPDDQYSEKQMQLETEKLRQKVSSLSSEDKRQVYEKGLQLQTQQSEAQDASCLPALKVSDIEPSMPCTELAVALAAGNVALQSCGQPTNGVTYVRAFCSLPALPAALRPYVPLFCSVLTNSHLDTYEQVALPRGPAAPPGVRGSPSSGPDACRPPSPRAQGVLFSSFCLERNLQDMMHLWGEIFNSPRFEEEQHFRVLVKMAAQELANGVPDSGHLYASIRANKTLTPAGDLQETFSGMEQVRLMKSIAEMADVKPVLSQLLLIKDHMLDRENMRCAVNAAPGQLSWVQQVVGDFLAGLGQRTRERKPEHPHVVEKPVPNGPGDSACLSGSHITRKLITAPTFKPYPMKTHLVLPFPVSYVGDCVRTAPYTHPDHASLRILARLMTAKFLHTQIREKGGAYGGGAKLSHSGVFTFYSYRDPRPAETLQAFAEAADWAQAGRFSQQDVDEAKLAVFSVVDAPVAPSDKGLDHFLYGLTDEMGQAQREQLFAVHRGVLIDVAHRYLSDGRSAHSLALLGPENARTTSDPSWVIQ